MGHNETQGELEKAVDNSKLEAKDAEFKRLVASAEAATDAEHKLSILQAVRAYPHAVLWSVLLSSALVMEGYDIVLIANFYAQPQFRMKYGQQSSDGTYQVSAAWQAGLSNGQVAGEIIGLIINSFVLERFGYRRVMLCSLAAMIAFVFLLFFAQNIVMLEVGEILCGIPWGIFQVITTSYAADVCPLTLRGALCAYVNVCWVFGQIIGSGVLRGTLSRSDQWAYRIPFGIQWVWPVPIFIGCLLAPESPWWLVRNGKINEARRSLRRLKRRGAASDSEVAAEDDARVALIVHTTELERKLTEGGSWLDCFKGVDLRRTEIACCTWIIQNWCGSAFMGYSTYFLEQAGLPTARSFDLSIGQYAMGIVGTMSSWVLMSRFGRRSLYMYGLCILFVLLMIIGFVSLAPNTSNAPSWAIGAMLLVYTVIYDATVGPVCYPLVAEIPSTRLRSYVIVLARTMYNIAGLVNGVIVPRMLNPTAWNWHAKSSFFWAGLCFLSLVYVFFRLPEPTGRSFAELDYLFGQKVSARKFSKAHADVFVEGQQSVSEARLPHSATDIAKNEVGHIENTGMAVP